MTRSKRSDAITKGPARAAARAMLRATGLTDADFVEVSEDGLRR